MDGPQRLVERLLRATNDHDLDALVACFAEDYENETPVHPGARLPRPRAGAPELGADLRATCPTSAPRCCALAVDGDTAWTEWEMTGTRRDGTAHHMRGVIIFGVRDGVAAWARFYLEPVDEDAGTVDDAVRDQVVRG